MAQERWMAFGQPTGEPRTVFEGLVHDDNVVPEPVVENFDDGSTLVRAWGLGKEGAEQAWRAAVAALAETPADSGT